MLSFVSRFIPRERSRTVRSPSAVSKTRMGPGYGGEKRVSWHGVATTISLLWSLGEVHTDKRRRRRRRRKELRLLWPINKTVAAEAEAGMEWF